MSSSNMSMEASVRSLMIDRVEGDVAVLIDRDTGAQVDMPVSWLPAGAAEGDACQLSLSRDSEASEAVRQEVTGALGRLMSSSEPMGSGELEL